jgi:hypothetical protein
MEAEVRRRSAVFVVVLIAASALSVFAFGQHAINKVSDRRHDDCVLLRQVSSNQEYVLRHHLIGTSGAERVELERRISSITTLTAKLDCP